MDTDPGSVRLNGWLCRAASWVGDEKDGVEGYAASESSLKCGWKRDDKGSWLSRGSAKLPAHPLASENGGTDSPRMQEREKSPAHQLRGKNAELPERGASRGSIRIARKSGWLPVEARGNAIRQTVPDPNREKFQTERLC